MPFHLSHLFPAPRGVASAGYAPISKSYACLALASALRTTIQSPLGQQEAKPPWLAACTPGKSPAGRNPGVFLGGIPTGQGFAAAGADGPSVSKQGWEQLFAGFTFPSEPSFTLNLYLQLLCTGKGLAVKQGTVRFSISFSSKHRLRSFH